MILATLGLLPALTILFDPTTAAGVAPATCTQRSALVTPPAAVIPPTPARVSRTQGAPPTVAGGGAGSAPAPGVGSVSFFCDPGQPNSSGMPTTLEHSSFTRPGAFHLEATGGPAINFGFFIASRSAGNSLPTSQGILCLDLPIGRYFETGPLQSVGNFNGSSTFVSLFGNSSVPTGYDVPFDLPSVLGCTILPGDTLHFQLWHRDVGGQHNLSNGISVTFP